MTTQRATARRIDWRRVLRLGVPILIAIGALAGLAWLLPPSYPAFFAAIRAGCNPPAGWNIQQGQTALGGDRLDEALAAFSRAAQADPGCEPAFTGRAEAEHALREDQLAGDDFAQAVRLCPECQDAYVERGDMERDQGHLTAALSDYTAAIALGGPRTAEALFERGRVYEWIGRLDPALADFDRLMPSNPAFAPDPDILYERALTYDAMGNQPGALADYTRFVSLADPADFRLAHARQRIGALQAARPGP